jgi:hypothetical protein
MARYLHQMGFEGLCPCPVRMEKITGDALTNLKIIQRMGLDVKEVAGPEQWADVPWSS